MGKKGVSLFGDTLKSADFSFLFYVRFSFLRKISGFHKFSFSESSLFFFTRAREYIYTNTSTPHPGPEGPRGGLPPWGEGVQPQGVGDPPPRAPDGGGARGQAGDNEDWAS